MQHTAASRSRCAGNLAFLHYKVASDNAALLSAHVLSVGMLTTSDLRQGHSSSSQSTQHVDCRIPWACQGQRRAYLGRHQQQEHLRFKAPGAESQGGVDGVHICSSDMLEYGRSWVPLHVCIVLTLHPIARLCLPDTCSSSDLGSLEGNCNIQMLTCFLDVLQRAVTTTRTWCRATENIQDAVAQPHKITETTYQEHHQEGRPVSRAS